VFAIDFLYDGRYLSDYGFIVCDFNESKGVVTTSSGSKISFEKVSRNGGKRFALTNAKYTECITCTFDICKNPDIFDSDEREITSDEYRDLMRWLNRKDFHMFQPFPDNAADKYYAHYNASFNVETIKIAEKTYGLRLTMETDSPFGYGEQVVEKYTLTKYADKIVFNKSDETGFIYPDMVIKCTDEEFNSDGKLEITARLLNQLNYHCKMIIKNCKKDETITIHGQQQIIETCERIGLETNDHDICNDFNYDFFKLSRSFADNLNYIYSNKNCEITISYYPIIKNIL